MNEERFDNNGKTGNVPAPIDVRDGNKVLVRGDDLSVVPHGAYVASDDHVAAHESSVIPTGAAREMPGEPEHIHEFDADRADESMSGGYASVDGRIVGRNDNRIVWLVVLVMSIMCIVVGVCSAVLTARFMQRGGQPPVISTDGEVKQHIAGVISMRKCNVVEVQCGGLSSSGIAMKREGPDVIVLTNAHCIEKYVTSEPQPEPLVRFFGEDEYYKASVVGYDGHYDVAVLRVEVGTLKFSIYDIENDSVLLRDAKYNEGDYVVSIGNAMSMGIASYAGIISRKSEILECRKLFGSTEKKRVPVVRTTAVVNAGMSGGGLFDMDGKLIGLGTYRLSNSDGVDTEGGASTDVEDTGFVTPMSVVYPIYKRILATDDGGQVGLFTVNLDTDRKSVIGRIDLPLIGIGCIYKGGELVIASVGGNVDGIETDDRIVEIGGVVVTSDVCMTTATLLAYHRKGDGKALEIKFSRGNNNVFVKTFDEFKYIL